MKKISFLLAALVIAAPALARVDVTCVEEADCWVAVSYDAGSEPNNVRAFALDITVDGGAKIVDVCDVNPDYWVFPGTITIVDGEVTDYGTPVAPADDPGAQPGLDSNGVTLEMASLYVGAANEPDLTGLLLKFKVDGACHVTITENATRGKVVSEKIVGDPSYEVDVNAPGCDVVCGVCKGDITATPGFGDPDGKVDTGDMANLLSALIVGGGVPPYYEIVSPSALQLERLDLTATAGFGCPDGKIDTGDMAKLLSHLILEGGGPPTYEAPCVEVEVCP